MKKNYLSSTLLILFLIISSCKTETKTDRPDEIGEKVFTIIQKIQTETKDDFFSNFISVDDLREFVYKNETTIGEKAKNEITSLTKEKYNSLISKRYNEIKKSAVKEGIELSKIKYLDFIYKTINEEGITGYEGTLYFKYNDKTFQVKSASIKTGKKIGLLEINRLKLK